MNQLLQQRSFCRHLRLAKPASVCNNRVAFFEEGISFKRFALELPIEIQFIISAEECDETR